MLGHFFQFSLFALFFGLNEQTHPTTTECQKDLSKMAQKLRSLAPIGEKGNNNCKATNGISTIGQLQWFEKNAFGILCCQNNKTENGILDGEIVERIAKLKNEMCQQLENGKSIGEMAENIGEKSEIKLEEIFEIETKIYQKMRNICVENDKSLESAKKEKMAKIMENALKATKTFFEAIRANTIAAYPSARPIGTDRSSAALKLYGRRKRRRGVGLGCVLLYLCAVISIVVGFLEISELLPIGNLAIDVTFGVSALCFLLMICVCNYQMEN